MKIWVDATNPPQANFFAPIVQELRTRGHEVSVTVRDFAQTRELAERFGLEPTPIGVHGGSGLRGILASNLGRTYRLARWAAARDFDLAVCANSYSHALAARLVRVPLVTLYDYDPNPATHIPFRLARRVVVPRAFPEESVRRYGAARKTRRYDGVKEEVYLAGFVPSVDFRVRHGIPEDAVLVVLRPPSDWSVYHRVSNPLFDELLHHAAAQPGVWIVFLPRLPEQVVDLSAVHVPDETYDGRDLVAHADVVISAGGTMNREAAVLGTPAYSVYAGELGGTDRELIARGRLVHVRSRDDFAAIAFVRKQPADSLARPDIVAEVVDLITGDVPGSRRRSRRPRRRA